MPRIDLKQGEQKKHVARALKEIRAGYVIVAPLEHGYVYLADAFSPFAVRAMHVLRGDEIGVAAQVLAYSLDTVKEFLVQFLQAHRISARNSGPDFFR